MLFGRNGFFNRRVLGNPGTEDFFGQPILGFFVGFIYVRRLFAISGDWIFAFCSESSFPSTRLTISGCEFFGSFDPQSLLRSDRARRVQPQEL